MKIYYLIVVCLLISCASTKDRSLDDYHLKKRLPILVESITNDSIFKTNMITQFGDLISFNINDTLKDVFISFSIIPKLFQDKLYPDSSKAYGMMKYYQWRHENTDRNKKNETLRIPKEFKSPESNYLITLNIADNNIFIFSVDPKDAKQEEYFFGYLIFAKNNDILEYKSYMVTIQAHPIYIDDE